MIHQKPQRTRVRLQQKNTYLVTFGNAVDMNKCIKVIELHVSLNVRAWYSDMMNNLEQTWII